MKQEIEYGNVVRLKSDNNIVGRIKIVNPNGILEYKTKDGKERHYAHRSKLELETDPDIIAEFDDMEDESFL